MIRGLLSTILGCSSQGQREILDRIGAELVTPFPPICLRIAAVAGFKNPVNSHLNEGRSEAHKSWPCE